MPSVRAVIVESLVATGDLRRCSSCAANGCPCFHQLAALIQQIAAPMRRLGLILDHVRQCGLRHLVRKVRCSDAQSLKVDRNPWTVKSNRPMHFKSDSIAC